MLLFETETLPNSYRHRKHHSGRPLSFSSAPLRDSSKIPNLILLLQTSMSTNRSKDHFSLSGKVFFLFFICVIVCVAEIQALERGRIAHNVFSEVCVL